MTATESSMLSPTRTGIARLKRMDSRTDHEDGEGVADAPKCSDQSGPASCCVDW